MPKSIKIILIIILCLPVMVQAGYNGRTARFCENHFIGTEYNPKLEKTCRVYWNMFSDQIKSTLPNHP